MAGFLFAGKRGLVISVPSARGSRGGGESFQLQHLALESLPLFYLLGAEAPARPTCPTDSQDINFRFFE